VVPLEPSSKPCPCPLSDPSEFFDGHRELGLIQLVHSDKVPLESDSAGPRKDALEDDDEGDTPAIK